jgi:hypothetical protein
MMSCSACFVFGHGFLFFAVCCFDCMRWVAEMPSMRRGESFGERGEVQHAYLDNGANSRVLFNSRDLSQEA